jgi:hypothetical protein
MPTIRADDRARQDRRTIRALAGLARSGGAMCRPVTARPVTGGMEPGPPATLGTETGRATPAMTAGGQVTPATAARRWPTRGTATGRRAIPGTATGRQAIPGLAMSLPGRSDTATGALGRLATATGRRHWTLITTMARPPQAVMTCMPTTPGSLPASRKTRGSGLTRTWQQTDGCRPIHDSRRTLASPEIPASPETLGTRPIRAWRQTRAWRPIRTSPIRA